MTIFNVYGSWIFLLTVVLPALAQSGIGQPELSVDAPGVAINGSTTPEPTGTGARSPGFGRAVMIVLLVYLAIRNVRNR